MASRKGHTANIGDGVKDMLRSMGQQLSENLGINLEQNIEKSAEESVAKGSKTGIEKGVSQAIKGVKTQKIKIDKVVDVTGGEQLSKRINELIEKRLSESASQASGKINEYINKEINRLINSKSTKDPGINKLEAKQEKLIGSSFTPMKDTRLLTLEKNIAKYEQIIETIYNMPGTMQPIMQSRLEKAQKRKSAWESKYYDAVGKQWDTADPKNASEEERKIATALLDKITRVKELYKALGEDLPKELEQQFANIKELSSYKEGFDEKEFISKVSGEQHRAIENNNKFISDKVNATFKNADKEIGELIKQRLQQIESSIQSQMTEGQVDTVDTQLSDLQNSIKAWDITGKFKKQIDAVGQRLVDVDIIDENEIDEATKKAITSLKGSITKKLNKLSSDTSLSADKQGQLFSSIEEGIQKLQEYGVATDDFVEKYNRVKEALGYGVSQENTGAEVLQQEAAAAEQDAKAQEELIKVKQEKNAQDQSTQTDSVVEAEKREEQQAEQTAKAEEKLHNTRKKKSGAKDEAEQIAEAEKVEQEQAESTVKAEEKLEEVRKKKSSSKKQNDQQTPAVTEQELNIINQMVQPLEKIIELINKKTEAFKLEGTTVDSVVQSEVDSLNILSMYIKELRNDIVNMAKGSAKKGTLIALPKIDETFKSITNLLTSLNKINADKIELNLTKIYVALDDFVSAVNNLKLNDNTIISSISKLLEKSQELEHLAAAVKASKQQINNITNNTQSQNGADQRNKQIKEYIELLNQRLKLETEIVTLKSQGVSDEDVRVTSRRESIQLLTTEIEKYSTLNLTAEEFKRVREETAAQEQKYSDAVSRSNQKQINDYEKLKKQALDLSRQMSQWLQSNPKATRTYGEQIQKYIAQLNKDAELTPELIDNIRTAFKQMDLEATQAGQKGTRLVDMLASRWKSVLAYVGSFTSFYRIVGYIRQAFSTIKELDTQLVDLRKTTAMNTEQLNEYYFTANKVAKEFGVTTSEIISQSAAWSRLGYNTAEATETMAKMSSMFQSISPGMTTDNATDYLVSTMKAYGVETDEVQRKILDNVNAIGKTLPKHMVTYGALIA